MQLKFFVHKLKNKQTKEPRHWSQEIQNSQMGETYVLVFRRNYCLLLILFVSFYFFNL